MCLCCYLCADGFSPNRTRKYLLNRCSTIHTHIYYSKLLNTKTFAVNAHKVASPTYRSIFDLVRAHKVLELTDQLLLSWYLALQVADRKLIQGTTVKLQWLFNFDTLYQCVH